MFFSCRNFCFLNKNLSGPWVYLQKKVELLWKFRVQVCVVWYVFMLRPLLWNDPYTFSQVQDYVNLRAVQMFYWSILFNKSLCYSTACCVLVSSRVEVVNVRHSYFFSRCMCVTSMLEHLISSVRPSSTLFCCDDHASTCWDGASICQGPWVTKWAKLPVNWHWTYNVTEKYLCCFKPLRFCDCLCSTFYKASLYW